MKSNLKFLLALGGAKLIMLNTAGQNICYFKQDPNTIKKDLTKIALLLNSR